MNKEYTVLVVGAGNLGRRHIQSIELCNNKVKTLVVDSSADALNQTKEALDGYQIENSVSYHQRLEDITDPVDVAIVATTANTRLPLLKTLLDKDIRNIVLEKVAFNSVSDIVEAQDLMKGRENRIWVNCPRRLYPDYIGLKKFLDNKKVIEFSISGTNYGLACNGIHYLDFFVFLTGAREFNIDNVEIVEITESKRKGFIECFGSFKAISPTGQTFHAECLNGSSNPSYTINIRYEGGCIEINEMEGAITMHADQEEREKRAFAMPYQSQLTGPMIDAIVENRDPEIVGFDESMTHHKSFVEAIYKQYAKSFGENERMFVPIT